MEIEIGRSCDMRERREVHILIWFVNLKGGHYTEDLGIEGMMHMKLQSESLMGRI
jgi:hypothetical protein